MEKLKIQDLEKGKLYRFYDTYDKCLSESVYIIDAQGDLYCGDPLSYKDENDFFNSTLTYNEVKNNYFVEGKKEIDWTKVPRGTKVQVRDSKNKEWKNAYFIKYDNIDRFHFRVGIHLDDDFMGIKLEDYNLNYTYCRIHESIKIPNEWYKYIYEDGDINDKQNNPFNN